MVRKVLVGVSLLGTSAVIATSALAQRASTPTLNATVGPGFTITVKQNGKVVKTLKAGTYKFVIADKSSIHAFALDGPRGFEKDLTTVPGTGTKTVMLSLKAGRYKYYCPPHEAGMFGRFTVK